MKVTNVKATGGVLGQKKKFGSKKFLVPGPGAGKVGPLGNLCVSKFGFLTLNQNWRPKFKDRIQFWPIVAKYILSWTE